MAVMSWFGLHAFTFLSRFVRFVNGFRAVVGARVLRSVYTPFPPRLARAGVPKGRVPGYI